MQMCNNHAGESGWDYLNDSEPYFNWIQDLVTGPEELQVRQLPKTGWHSFLTSGKSLAVAHFYVLGSTANASFWQKRTTGTKVWRSVVVIGLHCCPAANAERDLLCFFTKQALFVVAGLLPKCSWDIRRCVQQLVDDSFYSTSKPRDCSNTRIIHESRP